MFDRRILLTILVLLAVSGVVLAAQTQTNGVPQMPQLPAMPNGINSVTTAPTGSIPSIGDLMTVVDKATADQGKANLILRIGQVAIGSSCPSCLLSNAIHENNTAGFFSF